MFSFFSRKKSQRSNPSTVACPECSHLFQRDDLEQLECTCPACGKPVEVTLVQGNFT